MARLTTRLKKNPAVKKLTRILGGSADFLQDWWTVARKGQILTAASSLAYVTILSIVPILAVSLAVFQAFGGMKKVFDLVEPFVLENLTQGSSEQVIRLMHEFIQNAHFKIVSIGGVAALVLTSITLLANAETAINRAWHAPMKRPIFHRIVVYWLVITLGPLALSVTLGVATTFNIPWHELIPSGIGGFTITIALFFVVFQWVPQAKVRPAFALLSAAITALLWYLARFGYSLYTHKFVAYDKIYGALGAVPILLVWIDLAWVVILGGAALTFTLQKRFEERHSRRFIR